MMEQVVQGPETTKQENGNQQGPDTGKGTQNKQQGPDAAGAPQKNQQGQQQNNQQRLQQKKWPQRNDQVKHQHRPENHHGERREKRHMDDNVIYIGKKGVMNYVMAAMTQLNRGQREIHVKARGRSISKAVDVVQLLKNRFETAARIKNIDIGTEEVEADEGGKINVSTIDIAVTK